MGCCVAGGLEVGAGSVRGHQHAPGVRLASVPPTQLAARLVPCVCGILPPREGGLHDTWSGCTHSCHGEAASLVTQDVLWTRKSPVVCFLCLSGLLRRLRLAMIDRHISLLHAKRKKENRPSKHLSPPSVRPLDVTHGVLRCWRAGTWGGLGAGAPAPASLVIGCAVDPTIPCGLLYLSDRIAEMLAIGND